MRVAVLSDIHANLEALDAVLDRAQDERVDEVWILGDIVGYGGDPQAVIERLLTLPRAVLLAGNHDLAATSRFDVRWFNSAAAAAIHWTARVLAPESVALLTTLEPTARADSSVLVHGSVVDPASEYVLTTDAAGRSFEASDFSLCFFGHTHLPTAFRLDDEGRVHGTVLADAEPFDVVGRCMLNPGSVGQPRDRDPRASFMVFDSASATAVVHRVPYDVERAQKKIRAAGLPNWLADRLAVGR